MKNASIEQVVCWTYKDHRARWVVAVIACVNAVLSVAGAFSSGQGEPAATSNVLVAAILTAFWLLVVLVCLRPKVDGCLIRRDKHFELDLGRHVFDLFGGVSEVLHVFRHKRSIESIDIGALNGILMNRWLPRRVRRIGGIEAIVGVSIESGPLGPRLIVQDDVGGMLVIDDVHAMDVTRIEAAIKNLLVSQQYRT